MNYRLQFFSALTLLLVFSVVARAEETDPKVPFIDQTLQRSDDFYSGGMKSLVEDVVKTAEIKDDGKINALRKAAELAVRDKMDKSKYGLWKTWREMSRDGEVDQNQFWTAYRKLPEAILTPDRSPIWADALKANLSIDEQTKWMTEEVKRRTRIEKAIQDYLTKGRDTWKVQRIDNRKAQAEELITQTKLDAQQAQGLREGIDGAISRSIGAWGKGLEKQIREYVKSAFLGGAEDRIQQLEGGQINFGYASEPDALAAEEVEWRALLKSKLPAEGYASFEQREQQRNERRVRALGMLAVSELDRKLRLTEQQRSTLETKLTEVIRTHKAKIDTMLSQSYANSEIVLMVCNGVPATDAKAMLEPDQLEVWHEMTARYSGWWNQF
jgi:hypothetical protein